MSKRAVLATLAAVAPLASAATAGARSYDPPSWFKNGVERVKSAARSKLPRGDNLYEDIHDP
jgi:hypothetical protein